MNPFQRNLRIVVVFRCCYSLIFCIPVITLYWRRYGLTLQDIFWLQAVFSLGIVLMEIPTGYLGDWLGRRKTMLLSASIAACGWFFYAWARSFPAFLASELILGLAISLLSGTDTSLVYESLAEIGQTREFTRVEGRQHSFGMSAEAVSSLLGGLAAMVLPLHFLLLASSAAAVTAFTFGLGIKEPHRQTYVHPRGTWYGLYKIARFVFLRSRFVCLAVLLMAVCSLGTMLGVWLYQPFWQGLAIPVGWFGVLWAALALPSALASRWAYKIEEKAGRKAMLWLLPLPTVLGYLGLAFLPGGFALSAPYLVTITRGLHPPILGKYIHEETFSDKRATVFSIQSWVFRMLFFILGPVIGWIAQHAGLHWAFCVSAALITIAAGILIPLFIKRIRTSETSA